MPTQRVLIVDRFLNILVRTCSNSHIDYFLIHQLCLVFLNESQSTKLLHTIPKKISALPCMRPVTSCKFCVRMIAGGEFSLFYTNCEKQTVVSFDIRVALYNVKANGYKDFLSVGEDMLPVVFMVGHHPS